MENNDIIQLQIEDNAWLGRGVAYHDGRTIFVPFAVKGEVIEGIIRHSKKDWASARFMGRAKTIDEAVTPPCKFFSECGGCDYQHITYEKQLQIKDEIRHKTLIDHYKFDPSLMHSIVASPKQYGYRNKVRLGVLDSSPTFVIKNTRKQIKVDNCLLLKEEGQEALKNLDPAEYEKWHDLTIRVGENGVSIITEGGRKHGLGRRKVIQNPELEISYLDKKFRFGENAFFQLNKEVSELIFKRVVDEVESDMNVYDLYGGVGVIGILASDKAKNVIIVESSEDSEKYGQENIALNNCTNVTYNAARVEEYIVDNNLDGDMLIIDPPRAGISDSVMEAILKSNAQKIAYVSCDLQTFARDLDLLKDQFHIHSIEAFDMFPNTYHIENLAILTRK